MLIVQEDRKLRSYGLALRHDRLLKKMILPMGPNASNTGIGSSVVAGSLHVSISVILVSAGFFPNVSLGFPEALGDEDLRLPPLRPSIHPPSPLWMFLSRLVDWGG
jgi:hypothetical protein